MSLQNIYTQLGNLVVVRTTFNRLRYPLVPCFRVVLVVRLQWRAF